MKIINETRTLAYGGSEGNVETEDVTTKEVHLDEGEHRAYKITSLGNDMGLSPASILNEMKENGLSGEEMRAGAKAYNLEQKGYRIVGSSDNFYRAPRVKKIPSLQGFKINL